MKRVLLGLAVAGTLAAQESTTVYVRGSVAAPTQHLGDAVDHKLGLGAALGVDIPLEDGWRWRVDAGLTKFFLGTSQPGVSTSASATHLSVEGVYQLRDMPGPYLFAGIGGYVWSVPQSDGAGGTFQRNVGHAGGTLGLGWRLNPKWMAELRATGGRVDPNFSALWVSASVGLHF